ncbi:MAG: tRNA (adenosine(37)-N6)-threonylcarbamoyltransferase complex dimerization subunit type 1 TsaB [Hyphomicrobiaceae bacterium]
MNILAIDTCLGALSVGIGLDHADGRFCVTECYEQRVTGHAERLVPMIEAEMVRAGLGFRDLARIAVTLGPGTFTGVRTGISVARALRLSAGVELVGTSSLAVMAHRAFEISEGNEAARPVLVAVDARRGRLYAQLFGNGALNALSPPAELTAETAATIAIQHHARLAGSGAQLVAQTAGAQDLPIICDDLQPHASDLVWLARHLEPLAEVKPLYIRASDAKPQSDKRLARAP